MVERLAKFPGTCSICKNRIARGERIDIAPGRPARHVFCPPESPVKPPTINLAQRKANSRLWASGIKIYRLFDNLAWERSETGTILRPRGETCERPATGEWLALGTEGRFFVLVPDFVYMVGSDFCYRLLDDGTLSDAIRKAWLAHTGELR